MVYRKTTGYRDTAYYEDLSDAKCAAASRARKYKVPVSVKRDFIEHPDDWDFGCPYAFPDGPPGPPRMIPVWGVSWNTPEYVDYNDLFHTGSRVEVAPDNLSIADRKKEFERQEEAERLAERQEEAERQEKAEQDRIMIQNQWNKDLPEEWDDIPAPTYRNYERDEANVEILEDAAEYSRSKEREEYDGWFYSDDDPWEDSVDPNPWSDEANGPANRGIYYSESDNDESEPEPTTTRKVSPSFQDIFK